MGGKRRINLALQGGGAHGAFTWGALERLNEEYSLEVAAISGTSAGALNGAVYKAGLAMGGRAGAAENLAWLWDQMGAASDLPLTDWVHEDLRLPAVISRMVEYSPGYQMADLATRVFSPYGFGPGYRNPLEPVIRRLHFDRICAEDPPRLFVSATNVRTGKIRVFRGPEITVEAILASACLPTLFQAVEIHDPATGRREAYWDGGYTGNPALFPLYARDLPDDIVIVNINPLRREQLPITPAEIQNRINEISFNAALLGELRAIAFVKRLIAEGRIERGTMKDVNIHMVADDAVMTDLSVATKILPTPYVIQRLREAGRAAADRFLAEHGDKIGRACSVDLQATYG